MVFLERAVNCLISLEAVAALMNNLIMYLLVILRCLVGFLYSIFVDLEITIFISTIYSW